MTSHAKRDREIRHIAAVRAPKATSGLPSNPVTLQSKPQARAAWPGADLQALQRWRVVLGGVLLEVGPRPTRCARPSRRCPHQRVVDRWSMCRGPSAYSQGMALAVTYLGGPTVLLEYAGLTIVTDPTFDPPQSYVGDGGPPLVKTAGPSDLSAPISRAVDLVLLSPRARGQPRLRRTRVAGDRGAHLLDDEGGGRPVRRRRGGPRPLGVGRSSAGVTVTAVPALAWPSGVGAPPRSRHRVRAGGAGRAGGLRERGQRIHAAGRADRRSVSRRSGSRCCSRARRQYGDLRVRSAPVVGGCGARGRHPRRADRGGRAHRGLGALQRDPCRPRGRVRRSAARSRRPPRRARHSSSRGPRYSSGWPPTRPSRSSAVIEATSSAVSSHIRGGEVLRHPLARVRLRDHDVALREVPCDHDLRGGDAVGIGHRAHLGQLEQRVLALAERAPRLDRDALLLRELRRSRAAGSTGAARSGRPRGPCPTRR